MQTFISQFQGISGWHWGFAAGISVVAAILLQTMLLLYGMARRLSFEQQQQQLARERMKLSIRAEMLRCQEAEQARLVWNGFRKFRIAKKVLECQDVYSFYLAPHDGKPIPTFKPGQYLTFQLLIPGQPKPVIRCYSISDAPRSDNTFRVTIRKQSAPKDSGAPPGLASTFFNDHLREGDIVDVKAPGGVFFLEMSRPAPVVLISGGVGITPMLTMMNALLHAGSKREIWFFHGARNSKEHIQKAYVEKVVAENENVRAFVSYSSPGAGDALAKDYHEKGYFNVDLLKRLLPSNNYQFFICGPPKMMEDTAAGLAEWGVAKDRINYEAFGPPARKKVEPEAPGAEGAAASKFKITFGRSGKTVAWDPACESILDFAEKAGIEMSSGCRTGSCGTCLVAVKAGKVACSGHDAPGEEGSCLTCISRPETDVTLDV